MIACAETFKCRRFARVLPASDANCPSHSNSWSLYFLHVCWRRRFVVGYHYSRRISCACTAMEKVWDVERWYPTRPQWDSAKRPRNAVSASATLCHTALCWSVTPHCDVCAQSDIGRKSRARAHLIFLTAPATSYFGTQ